eukprot:2430021-Pleurochrysis_carterae.AAC.1
MRICISADLSSSDAGSVRNDELLRTVTDEMSTRYDATLDSVKRTQISADVTVIVDASRNPSASQAATKITAESVTPQLASRVGVQSQSVIGSERLS